MDDHLNRQIEELSVLWHRLIHMSRRTELENAFPNLKELTTNEISIIRMVSEKPEIILREICETLELPKSTLTNTINRLEKKGYIKRIISKQDLRSYGLSLTKKGKMAQEEHLKYETAIYGEILEALSGEEKRTTLLKLMNEIMNHLEQKFPNGKDPI